MSDGGFVGQRDFGRRLRGLSTDITIQIGAVQFVISYLSLVIRHRVLAMTNDE